MQKSAPFLSNNTAQKIMFYIKDFFSKCDQIRRKLRIWSHLLKKSLMEKLHFFCEVFGFQDFIFNVFNRFFLTLSVSPNESINTFVLKDHIFHQNMIPLMFFLSSVAWVGQNMGHKLTFFIWVSVSLFLTYDIKVFKKWIYFE